MNSAIALPARGGPIAVSGERVLTNIVIFFCFFPFFRYIPVEIETQPLAAMFAGIGLLVYGIDDRRGPRALLTLAIIIVAGSLHSIMSERSPASAVGAQTLAYLSPLLVASFLWERLHLVSTKLVLGSGVTFLVVGLAQFANVVPGPIDAFLTVAISRYHSEILDLKRGVVMLANEPDYASRQILLTFAFCFWFFLEGRLSKARLYIASLLVLFAILILNKSITGLSLLLIFLLPLGFFCLVPRTRAFVAAGLAGVAFIAFAFIEAVDLSNLPDTFPRPILLAGAIAEGVKTGSLDLNTIVIFASSRVMTDLSGVLIFLERPLLGCGVGQGDAAVAQIIMSNDLLRFVPFQPSLFATLKPAGYILCLIAEVGLLGLAGMLFVIKTLFSEARAFSDPGLHRAFAFACLILALAQMMLLGPHSLPLPPVLFAMAGSGLREGRAS